MFSVSRRGGASEYVGHFGLKEVKDGSTTYYVIDGFDTQDLFQLKNNGYKFIVINLFNNGITTAYIGCSAFFVISLDLVYDAITRLSANTVSFQNVLTQTPVLTNIHIHNSSGNLANCIRVQQQYMNEIYIYGVR